MENVLGKQKKGIIFADAFERSNFYWRNGRVVECTGLENQRGSHLRGFESLFLRKMKNRNESFGFFICRNRKKFTFLRN